jgi:hypothetical protein
VFGAEGTEDKLEDAQPYQLGNCGEFQATKEDTLILNGGGTTDAIADRVALIRDMIDETSSDYEKEKLSERLARLAGGVAVLKVGGASEVEVRSSPACHHHPTSARFVPNPQYPNPATARLHVCKLPGLLDLPTLLKEDADSKLSLLSPRHRP